MAGFRVGIVTHYYPKIEMAIVDLVSPLYKGEHIHFTGSITFSQTIHSIYQDQQLVDSAASGDTVGLKVTHSVSPGDELIKSL